MKPAAFDDTATWDTQICKSDNDGKDWYFWFDDDDSKIS